MNHESPGKVPPFPLPPGVHFSSGSFRVTQDNDDSSELPDPFQHLEIAIEDAGGGPYLAIKTERWAIDGEEIDRFAAMLRGVLGLAPDGDGSKGEESGSS